MHKLKSVADAMLIDRARDGNSKAFAELWRRHRKAGLKAAHSLAPMLDAEDLVSEAFTKILVQLEKGKGPTGGFRPYLYFVIKNTAADTYRENSSDVSVDDLDGTLVAAVENADPSRSFDLDATRKAYASLSEREQEVLWYTEVERLPPRKAALHLGISASAAAALAMRARNHLRRAWLVEHVNDPKTTMDCRLISQRIADYRKNKLSLDAISAVEDHIEGCFSCSELMHEAERVYARSGALIAASVLGYSAVKELSPVTGGTSQVAATTVVSWQAPQAALVVTATAASVALVCAVCITWIEGESFPIGLPIGSTLSQETENSVNDSTAQANDETSHGESVTSSAGGQDTYADNDHAAVKGAEPREGENNAERDNESPAQRPEPIVKEPSAPSQPNETSPKAPEPIEPLVPEIIDDLPRALPRLTFSPITESAWRVGLRGKGAEPGATVRLKAQSSPVAGGPRSGVVLETQAWSDGSWSFASVGGMTPINVTIEIQQLTESASSAWALVSENALYPISIFSRTAGDFNGKAAWYIRGWPGANWGLQEVGQDWPRAGGVLNDGGGAAIPVPGDVPAGETREYEVGYWVKGRFVPNSERLTVTG